MLSPAGQSTAPSAAALEQRDEALVRVVHAIPAGAPIGIDAGEIDLVVPGATAALFDGVDFQSVTGYEELESWLSHPIAPFGGKRG